MKTKIMGIVKLALVLAFSGMARADIVELDLFNLGCPTEFNWDIPYWQTDFNLGVTFSDISNVNIDWSGEIMAGLGAKSNPDEPFPLDVGIGIALKKPPLWRYIILEGGEITYPEPETFDCLSEFLYGDMPLSELLDGQGMIKIQYMELIMLNGTYVEHGSINLDKATLLVEGIIIPEPATLFLFGMGIIWVRIRTRRTLLNSKG